MGLIGLGNLPTVSALNMGFLASTMTISVPTLAIASLIGFGIKKAYQQTPAIEFSSSMPKKITDWSQEYPHLTPSDTDIIPPEISLLFEKETQIEAINITDKIQLIEIKNDNISAEEHTEKKSFILLETQKGLSSTDYIFTTHKDMNGISYPVDYTPSRKNNPDDKDENREIFSILMGDKKYAINCPHNSDLTTKARYIQKALKNNTTTSNGIFETFTIKNNPISNFAKKTYHNIMQTGLRIIETENNPSSEFDVFVPKLPPSLDNIILKKHDDTHYILKMSDDEKNAIDVTLNHKNTDIDGRYTHIHFTINEKPCDIRLYAKQFTEKNLHEAIQYALKEIQNKADIPYEFKYRDDAYPYPTHSPLAISDSADKLVKDYNGYYIYSAKDKILSSEYAFNPVPSKASPRRKTLQTPHILHFRIKDDIYTITLYKNSIDDTDIQKSIQKALTLNDNNPSFDDNLNLLQNSEPWKEKYPHLNNNNNNIKTFPKEIQSLFDKESLIHQKTLYANKDLIEVHTSDKKYFILLENHHKNTDFDKITFLKHDNNQSLEALAHELSSYNHSQSILSYETAPAIFIPIEKSKTAKDWQETYSNVDIKNLPPEISLLFDSKTTTKEITIGENTKLIELIHEGKKSFLTYQKNTPAHIFTPVISEELNLGGNKKTTITFHYNGTTYHNGTLSQTINTIDIRQPSIKEIFAPKNSIPKTLPSITLYPSLKKRYQLLHNNTDYHIHNTDDNTRTVVTLLSKQKDSHGQYTQINFQIDGKEYIQKIYSHNAPKDTDIQTAFDKALEHLEKNPTVTSHILDDIRDPAHPPVTSQTFDSDLGKIQLIKRW